ncbi:MAG: hypothetical protein AAGA68_13250 [Pseudomonadota bacterium]
MLNHPMLITPHTSFAVLALIALSSHGANAEEASPRNCDTPWANHGVSEATIVYGADELIPPGEGPFLPMDEVRNTPAYRALAFDFFEARFGVAFDVNNPGIQIAVDASGRVAEMQPIKFGLGSTHQVYAIDAQRIPRWRHRMPMTNVALRDDGYFVFIGADGFEVNGTYGGEAGVTLPAGTVVLLGEYRMFDENDELMDTLRYFSDQPAFAVVDPGAPLPTTLFTITCKVQSEIFGEGQVGALGQLVALEDGSTDLDFRYTLRFPARIRDSGLIRPRCKPARALE